MNDLPAARLQSRLDSYRTPVVEEMAAALEAARGESGAAAAELYRWMRYHLGWDDRAGASRSTAPGAPTPSGKLMRPAALLLAHEATGGEVRRALPAAAAVELVHNFSLLHDDIEDASERRRDRATVWTFAGIPQAINAGDGMFTIARLAMHRLETRALDAGTILGAMRELDEACLRLVEGQYLDIAFEQREQVSPAEYIEMTCGKTAALFASSFAIGAVLAEAPPETVASFRSFGRHLGVAFQAIDDVLGIWGDPAVTGKPVGDDLRARKMTFPVLAAIQAGGTAGDRVGEAYRRRAEPLEAEQIADLATAVEAAGGRKAADDLARTELDAAIGCLSSLELADEDRNLFAAFAALATRRSA